MVSFDCLPLGPDPRPLSQDLDEDEKVVYVSISTSKSVDKATMDIFALQE